MAAGRVVIAGAGIAGMSAALRLLEAGFAVTVLEKRATVGGKFGAVPDENGVMHEHAYHFLSDWCLNFWSIAACIGLSKGRHFVPRNAIKFLRPRRDNGASSGRYHFSELKHGAAQLHFWSNINSGVIPPDDMIAYTYSLLDLLTEGADHDPDELEFLNRSSVNGFMRSRPYMTDLAALLHQEALLKAFAVPSYETSVRSYRTFLRYFGRDTGGWVLKGDCETKFWRPFRRKLESYGSRYCLRRNIALEHLEIERDPKLRRKLRVRRARLSSGELLDVARGHLILAVPYPEVVRLVEQSNRLRTAVPDLLAMRKLRSRQMASLDLYFSRALPGIPAEHVTLIDDRAFAADSTSAPSSVRGSPLTRYDRLAEGGDIASRYALSFVDNFQVWRAGEPRTQTWLNVIAADFDELAGLPNAKARDAMVKELQRYLTFDRAQVDWDRTRLETNADAQLFTNSVGSWQYRPETRADDPAYRDRLVQSTVTNLYLAGDYCRSTIDLVSLEGAVTTGIAAARAIAKNARRPEAIAKPLEPPEVSREEVELAKVALAPLLAEVQTRRRPR